MLTESERRANIRELVELVDAERERAGWSARGMRVGDACEMHTNAGLLGVYDTAIPQGYADAYWQTFGESPAGIVWSYDVAKTFGAPYALTATQHTRLMSWRSAPARPVEWLERQRAELAFTGGVEL